MKTKITGCLVAIVVVIVLAVFSGAIYTVKETEQVIITQFGETVGDPINPTSSDSSEAGLHFKIPFLWKDVSAKTKIT